MAYTEALCIQLEDAKRELAIIQSCVDNHIPYPFNILSSIQSECRMIIDAYVVIFPSIVNIPRFAILFGNQNDHIDHVIMNDFLSFCHDLDLMFKM